MKVERRGQHTSAEKLNSSWCTTLRQRYSRIYSVNCCSQTTKWINICITILRLRCARNFRLTAVHKRSNEKMCWLLIKMTNWFIVELHIHIVGRLLYWIIIGTISFKRSTRQYCNIYFEPNCWPIINLNNCCSKTLRRKLVLIIMVKWGGQHIHHEVYQYLVEYMADYRDFRRTSIYKLSRGDFSLKFVGAKNRGFFI